MADTNAIGKLTLKIDATELDAAIEKAKGLAVMLDEIDTRASAAHPDVVATALSSLAKSHGYKIVRLELQNHNLVGSVLPRHQYDIE